MNELNGHDVEDLRPGLSATFSRTITEADIVLFAGVSGDNNAVHLNDEFARTTPFGGRIAHGMLSASVISAAIANRLPGPARAPSTWASSSSSALLCAPATRCMPRWRWFRWTWNVPAPCCPPPAGCRARW